MFPQKGYIFTHDLPPCHNSKSARTFKETKGMPILERPGNSLDMNPIEYNDEIGKKMLCKKKRCGSEYVKRGIV